MGQRKRRSGLRLRPGRDRSNQPSAMDKNKGPKRTAILIRCTEEEAARIRQAAQRERRTVSAFVLHAVTNRMRVQETANRAALLHGAAYGKAEES